MIGDKTVLEVIETVTQYFEDGNWVALLILSVFIAKPLFRAVIGYKEGKKNDLKSALEIEGLSDDVRFVVQESLNRTYFYRATGLSGDPFMRAKIRVFLESTRGDVSIFGVWRGREYIDIKDERLLVQFSWYDKVNFYLQIASSGFLFVYSIFLCVALIFVWSGSLADKVPVVAQAVLFMVMSTWFAWRASNFYVAKTKIKPAFERYGKKDKAETKR